MQIDVGQRFITRDGRVAEIVARQDWIPFVWIAKIGHNFTAYLECGKWSEHGIMSPLDLVGWVQ